MKALVIILFYFISLGCSKEKNPGSGGTLPPVTGPAKTWLALGDSYTIGQSVSYAERFPVQTAGNLIRAGINMQAPDFIAATGWTTTNLSNAIAMQNPGSYDVVTLLIGVNDQYQTRDTTGYRQRFTSLLSRAIQLAGGKATHVFVLSIPDYSVTPFAATSDTARIRREIDWFNAINKQVTGFYSSTYLNITPSTREARNDPSLLAADGLHPSGREYQRWADRLAPLMLPVLR